MDLSSEPSRDEDRIMERQLYRAGQTPAAPKSSAPRPGSSSSLPKSKSLSVKKGDGIPLMQRRLVRVALCAAWLLFLTGASYCVFYDPIEDTKEQQRAIWQDPNLSFEEKRKKSEQLVNSLSDRQRFNLYSNPEFRVKLHDDMDAFFKLSPAEQKEQLKKEILEKEKRRAEGRGWGGRGPGGGGPGAGGRGPGGPGGGGPGAGGRGPGGAGAGAGGRGPGGSGGPGGGRGNGGPPGGGGSGGSTFNRGDLMPPETWEQMGMKRSMEREVRQEMGLGGGRGGPGGGRGGRGGRGGPPQ